MSGNTVFRFNDLGEGVELEAVRYGLLWNYKPLSVMFTYENGDLAIEMRRKTPFVSNKLRISVVEGWSSGEKLGNVLVDGSMQKLVLRPELHLRIESEDLQPFSIVEGRGMENSKGEGEDRRKTISIIKTANMLREALERENVEGMKIALTLALELAEEKVFDMTSKDRPIHDALISMAYYSGVSASTAIMTNYPESRTCSIIERIKTVLRS